MNGNLPLLKWLRDSKLEAHCMRRLRTVNYEPGHVRYQFGHYPSRVPYDPTEADWKLMDIYVESGLKVIHIWWWDDLCGYFGKAIREPINEKGLRRFIAEAHRRGLKVIPYVSPGYLDVHNPIYRPEWSRGIGHLVETYYDMDMLCPGSRSWRACFLRSVERMLDDLGFDGVYWDGGLGLGRPGCGNPRGSDHVHFVEFNPANYREQGDHSMDAYYGEVNDALAALWNDFLCELYVRVKRRNGVVVAHIGSDRPSPFKDKCWDYFLLGEGVPDILVSLDRTKTYDPYVIRFLDWSRIITRWKERDLTPDLSRVPHLEHQAMAASVPYMQFSWLEDGNYGEDEDIQKLPGIRWTREYCLWTEWMKAQRKAGLPPLDGASFAAGRDRYLAYLRLYNQMTADGAVACIEVKGLAQLPFPVSQGRRRVSVFVNDSLWVAIGNLEDQAGSVRIAGLEADAPARDITLPPGRLTVLKYTDLRSLPDVLTLGDA